MAGAHDDASLIVVRGDNLAKLLPKLRTQGIVTGDRLLWQVLARETGASGRIQTGEYALSAATTPRARRPCWLTVWVGADAPASAP